MKQDMKCFLGCHKYEVLKEEDIKLAGTEVIIGKVIVSRCNNCGKINTTNINTVSFEY